MNGARRCDPVVFVDIETTGLDPDRHDIWEIGLITAEGRYGRGWFVQPDLATAEPAALQLGGYYSRSPVGDLERAWWTPHSLVAETVARVTADRFLVGVNTTFDAAFLDRWLRRHGQAPAWRYHLIDAKALLAGALSLPPPWRSKDVADLVPRWDAHSALADARWAMDIYTAAIGDPWPSTHEHSGHSVESLERGGGL